MSKPKGRGAAAHCPHCGEPLMAGDDLVQMGDALVHRECAVRMIVGGVNHQAGTCSCCGGDRQPDPPNLTTREAAIAALAYFRRWDRANPYTGPADGGGPTGIEED